MSDCDNGEKACAVCVAVRIRPQSSREIIDMCRICTTVTPGEPQIMIGSDKAFTFDHVFGPCSTQSEIYTNCVKSLVENALKGYNATVLAYGQTGSGKTYTMGTGFDYDINAEAVGIIPRAIHSIFTGIDCIQSSEDYADQENFEYSIAAQFMELYNEDIVDLLDPCSRDKCFKIHENSYGQITVSGLTIKTIYNPQDALKCLQQGALARSTASTKMNDQSSRSHALFSILIRRRRVISNFCIDDSDSDFVTTKFNFVDLAGSERLKRTGATGERAREGISINCGLLALGNVISALADKSKKCTHIPYRDSKLTRLLQDSLGGNSKTLMISCVSPCDRDFMETLNTLKYANRAKNIKNKVSLNENQSTRTICQLRREIQQLQMELCDYKQGKVQVSSDYLSDTSTENAMLLADNKRLHQRLKSFQETIDGLIRRNSQLAIERHTKGSSSESDQSVIAGYISDIENLQAKLLQSEGMCQQLMKSPRLQSGLCTYSKDCSDDDPDELINMARRELEKDREILMTRSLPNTSEDGLESCNSDDDSSGSSDDKSKKDQADLNDINTDIAIKTKLIEQLELSKKRMQVMRQHYEEKLNILNCRIENTRKERDEVLSQMGPNNCNEPKDKMKQVRKEYERKIKDMSNELKKLQNTEREHSKQQREIKIQETKLRNLKSELTELKCLKTRLLRKISENSSRFKKEESQKTREIALLRKQQRRQENTVKSLQVQMQAKDQVLKRKNEEVTALRRNHKALERATSRNDGESLNLNVTQKKWDKMTRAITNVARNRQASLQLEKELERLMCERDELYEALDKFKNSDANKYSSEELASEEDNLNSHIDYVQDNITQIQQAIMEIEVGKNSFRNESKNLQTLVGNVQTISEAKFLLEQLSNVAITYSCNSAFSDNRLFENEVLLKELQQENHIQQQMLQHCLAQSNNLRISDLLDNIRKNQQQTDRIYCNASEGSCHSFNSNETYDVIRDDASDAGLTNSIINRLCRSPSPAPTIDLPEEKSSKVRKHTIKPQELLFGDNSNTPKTRNT